MNQEMPRDQKVFRKCDIVQKEVEGKNFNVSKTRISIIDGY